jgi:hypothetical protein
MLISLRRSAQVVAVPLVLALVVAGCSSSASDSGGSPSTPSTPSDTSASSGTPAGSPTPADPATRKAVTAAFVAFFSSTTSVARSEVALQHGASFRTTLQKEATGSHAQKSSATVSAVTVSGDLARVTFTILQDGVPLLPNTQGFGVRENGKWKVAAQTFCSLLVLEGTAPPACKDPAITALPN